MMLLNYDAHQHIKIEATVQIENSIFKNKAHFFMKCLYMFL